MYAKFNKTLSSYDYLVMFDLASKLTGVCVWDVRNGRPVETSVIRVAGDDIPRVAKLYREIDLYFADLSTRIPMDRVLVCKEAMPSQVRGGSSTVQTFMALARSHAILDLYLYQHGFDVYDDVGVYPASTHAYCRKVMGLSATEKVTKDTIRDCVYAHYGLSDLSYDESDAVFLASTLVDYKWNRDLDDEIRNTKRHLKELVVDRARNACQNKIEALEELKRKEA